MKRTQDSLDSRQVLSVIEHYSTALNLLDAYDHQSLLQYGCPEKKAPGDWLEAFSRLRKLLEGDCAQKDPVSGRLVVFLDELPWMDTARSGFKGALDYFWNSWGSSRTDLLLIVCGSATSWIIKHILADTGGLYNRVTRTT